MSKHFSGPHFHSRMELLVVIARAIKLYVMRCHDESNRFFLIKLYAADRMCSNSEFCDTRKTITTWDWWRRQFQVAISRLISVKLEWLVGSLFNHWAALIARKLFQLKIISFFAFCYQLLPRFRSLSGVQCIECFRVIRVGERRFTTVTDCLFT